MISVYFDDALIEARAFMGTSDLGPTPLPLWIGERDGSPFWLGHDFFTGLICDISIMTHGFSDEMVAMATQEWRRGGNAIPTTTTATAATAATAAAAASAASAATGAATAR